jgi:hypothetical protein
MAGIPRTKSAIAINTLILRMRELRVSITGKIFMASTSAVLSIPCLSQWSVVLIHTLRKNLEKLVRLAGDPPRFFKEMSDNNNG